MISQGRRSNICNEDRATLESVLSALQGHRQTAAPAFFSSEGLPPARRTLEPGIKPGSAFYSVRTPGGGCFFVSKWNRCLAPKAKTPGPGGAEQFPL